MLAMLLMMLFPYALAKDNGIFIAPRQSHGFLDSGLDDGVGGGSGMVGTCQHLNHTSYGIWEEYYEPRYKGWGEAICLTAVGAGEWKVLGTITKMGIATTPAGAISAGVSFAVTYYSAKACDRIDKKPKGSEKFMQYIGTRRLATRWVGYYDNYMGRCNSQIGAQWWDWK